MGNTEVTIQGQKFYINDEPTYAGRNWNGHEIEGLLLNNRQVQATFDDENSETRRMWAYPDTEEWDADRNTQEFIDALPISRDHGVLGITVNFQGGNPKGYGWPQPWENNAFAPDGEIRPPYLERMGRVLEAMDGLGMVAILGVFYFGQDERLESESAVVRSLESVVQWVLDSGYGNVLLEVNNECNVKKYEHEILMPHRVHELIDLVKNTTKDGQRLLVSTSYGGGFIPLENVVAMADYLMIHGNGVKDPARIAEMVDETRQVPGYRPMPILFNEDDHYNFDKPMNNFVAAISKYASWGCLDIGEGNYRDGYQSAPVNWGLSTDRKIGFHKLAKEISGV
ncbi:MAG: hypothetical protein HOH77_21665 [Candidatus Latescibacteria bacterium]|jgi:hypothetical protein|nr:hypothetical protein [Candidatus Latescibacterota bacterium]